MRSEVRGNVKNSVGRLIFALLSILVQVIWIVSLVVFLNRYSAILTFFTSLVSLALALRIYAKRENAAFKMPWVILILLFPVGGTCIYVLFGHKNSTKGIRRQFNQVHTELTGYLKQDPALMQALEKRDFGIANQCRYLSAVEKFPVYGNTDVVFYKEASEGFEAQLEALEQAKQFIFMDYHAIEEAAAFERLKDVLWRKASQGVEVRVLYDDVGSIGFIDFGFVRRMELCGIRCKVFNPVKPVLQIFMNNRDHRKITVIDGKVGFTGGYNLADEYFNITHPYGKWKDTGVKLTGDAVVSLTALFLEMWNCTEKKPEDIAKYMVVKEYEATEQCYVQPYGDGPTDEAYVGENVYLNLIKNAKHTLYVTTPYLIISDEMQRELQSAALRGVDVRIITPGIPDKKLIYRVTRSYYAGLVRSGVRIFEYTPGFLHGKQMLADGEAAVLGTINLDFRSLYHHFENAVFLYGCSAIKDMAEDFSELVEVSREVTEEYQADRFYALRGLDAVLRLIAPLL